MSDEVAVVEKIDTVAASLEEMIDAGQLLGQVLNKLGIQDATKMFMLKNAIEGMVWSAVHYEAEKQAQHWAVKFKELSGDLARLQAMARELT